MEFEKEAELKAGELIIGNDELTKKWKVVLFFFC